MTAVEKLLEEANSLGINVVIERFKPTINLRWENVVVGIYAGKEYKKKELQQLWKSNTGLEEWRQIEFAR